MTSVPLKYKLEPNKIQRIPPPTTNGIFLLLNPKYKKTRIEISDAVKNKMFIVSVLVSHLYKFLDKIKKAGDCSPYSFRFYRPLVDNPATKTKPPRARNTGNKSIIVLETPVKFADAMTDVVIGIATATIRIIATIRPTIPPCAFIVLNISDAFIFNIT